MACFLFTTFPPELERSLPRLNSPKTFLTLALPRFLAMTAHCIAHLPIIHGLEGISDAPSVLGLGLHRRRYLISGISEIRMVHEESRRLAEPLRSVAVPINLDAACLLKVGHGCPKLLQLTDLVLELPRTLALPILDTTFVIIGATCRVRAVLRSSA